MGLRFSRRLTIVPGLRINLGKRGASVSIGHRGGWVTVGSRGARATLGLPGTGIYWTEHAPVDLGPHDGHRLLFVIVALLLAGAIVAALAPN
jgi:hypothetical protein